MIQAANIVKIRKAQVFFQKKVNFPIPFLRFKGRVHSPRPGPNERGGHPHAAGLETARHRFAAWVRRQQSATTAAAQRQEPAGKPEAQEHIVGRLQVRYRRGTEHECPHPVGGDIVLHAVDAVLHRHAPHLTAHQCLAASTAQLIKRHTAPVIGRVGRCHGQLLWCLGYHWIVGWIVIHCLQVLRTVCSQIVRWDSR